MPYRPATAEQAKQQLAYLYYRRMAKDMGLDDVQFVADHETEGLVIVAWRDGVTARCELPATADMDVVVGTKIRELAKQLEDLNA